MSKNCIFCGAEIDDDDLFCGECGKKQDPEEKKRIEQAEAEA
ncbi:MAG: zinc-ribbon domain-containing protein, partial [Firmicutes bacterium]|nr:zinc-ribbon domain-containing protein [Bacillota bacterium]